KQGEGFRYHGRDLALLRGQMEGATVVLGSATPALTSYQRALDQQTGLLELDCRVAARPMPDVELIDMTASPFGSILSEALYQALEENLAAGHQSLLLLNRRGFAPFLLCADCGLSFHCPNCDITLTYHRRELALRCHYCDFQQRPPEVCPRCQGHQLDPEGVGTERLEAQLEELFPQARIARMDRDSMGRKDAHRHLVARIAAGEVDILVGTQMVAKGHDFPGVTLVGVVNADATLNFPDFRAAERTFSLLSQVAGRAGRGEQPGRVLIQTYAPEHYALTSAAAHDYQGFFAEETTFRRELGYPPFGWLVNLVLSGNNQQAVERTAQRIAGQLRQGAGRVEVLGPASCLLPKLRGKWRQQVLLKGAQRSDVRRRLAILPQIEKLVPRGVSLVVDVDPVDMF
ncbi:MAG TPA: primosomal protein N', partial [Geothermobacteraceae bacterium]|nr:primosomal protein N' [Geothermobacteraceae bacterium]